MQSLAIPVLSSLLDRLYRLDLNLNEYMQVAIKMQSHSSLSCDKRFMNSEANRRSTFQDWPHMDYKWLLPDTLAQAGFYHQPAQVGDDRTICFVCNLCLVAWEQSDQPWSEHERHSPICQFIRGEITENVSFSSTVATQPAVQVFKDEKEKVSFPLARSLSCQLNRLKIELIAIFTISFQRQIKLFHFLSHRFDSPIRAIGMRILQPTAVVFFDILCICKYP